ncbi:MAG: hypothetical protein FH752_15835 [Marinobacter adhaerens]|uniref:Uncharacterized protein n=1 Tax=Marinobacter adhaerens TaxID=1033846 RepID=A0A844I566_9GAMM|nr:hypothetical protein [Marinobacter adhaerens]
MLINNHPNSFPSNYSVGSTKAMPDSGSSSSKDSNNTPLVTLSANAQSEQSTAAKAVKQYEATIQQNGTTQQSQETESKEGQPAKAVTLSSIPPVKMFNEADVRDYEKKLANAFSNAGIDTSQPISLSTDYQGKVIVKGDHPDKDRIEAMFAEDKDLRNGFVQTSQHYLLKEIYRLNQELAQKVDGGVNIDLASEWLVRSAKQATAASANGLTLRNGSFDDPFSSRALVAKLSNAYGV